MTPSSNTPRKPIKPDHSSSIRKTLSNLIKALIIGYGIGMIVILCLRIVPGERLIPIAVFNSFLHLMWLPALILLPLCLLFRRWRMVLLLSPTLLAFVISYGQLFAPRPDILIPQDSITLEVMSFNVLARRPDYRDTVAIIQQSGADVVAIQEINTDLAVLIRANLMTTYPYMKIHAGGANGIGQTGGQAVLSRYPILEDDFWFYQSPHLGNQRVLLDIDGREIVLYNAHPAHPGLTQNRFFDPQIRQQQINDILRRAGADAKTLPVFLMGDFNMTDLSEAYGSVAQHYQDVWQSIGRGLGWTFAFKPETFPSFLRLDYIFHDEHFIASAASVSSQNGGSDHSPVQATLHLPPE